MVPKKKEHSNDLRILVIRHDQNGESQQQKHDFLDLLFNIWSTSINQQNVFVVYLDVIGKGKQIDLFNVGSSSIDENQLPRSMLRSRMN